MIDTYTLSWHTEPAMADDKLHPINLSHIALRDFHPIGNNAHFGFYLDIGTSSPSSITNKDSYY